MLRYLIGREMLRLSHVGFPVGTFAVNLVGCVLIGALGGYFLNDETQPVLRAALTIGFCGGFTTFSAVSLETFGLIVAGNWPRAAAYVVVSVVACIAGTAAGYQLMRQQ